MADSYNRNRKASPAPAGKRPAAVKGEKNKINESPKGFLAILRSKEESTRTVRTIAKLLLVMLAVFLLVWAWRYRVDLSCTNISQCAKDSSAMRGFGKDFPSTINGSSSLSLNEIGGDGIALLSDSSFTVYNSTAREATNRAHYMSSPTMHTSGRYALLLDLGRTSFRLETIASTAATGRAERPLVSGSVSRNGRYALVMAGSSLNNSYPSSVVVYDLKGNQLHKWHSSDYYITDAALSPDGNYIAMCGISAREGDMVSVILVHRVGSDQVLGKFERKGVMYLSIESANTGVFYAVGDNETAVVSANGRDCDYITYTGGLLAFDVSYDSGLALCTSDVSSESSSKLTVYDTDGKKRFSKDLPMRAKAVAMSSNGCCASGQETLVAYRMDGQKVSEWRTATSSIMLMIGWDAYIADGIRISSIDLKASPPKQE